MDFIPVEVINDVTEQWGKWVGFLIGFSGFLIALPTLRQRFNKAIIGPIALRLESRKQARADKLYGRMIPAIEELVQEHLREHTMDIQGQKTSIKHIMAENEQFKTYMYSTVAQFQKTVGDMKEQARVTQELILDLKDTILKNNQG